MLALIDHPDISVSMQELAASINECFVLEDVDSLETYLQSDALNTSQSYIDASPSVLVSSNDDDAMCMSPFRRGECSTPFKLYKWNLDDARISSLVRAVLFGDRQGRHVIDTLVQSNAHNQTIISLARVGLPLVPKG